MVIELVFSAALCSKWIYKFRLNRIFSLMIQIQICYNLQSNQEVVVVVIIWSLDLKLPVQSVSITIKVVSSNHVQDEVCSIQHYVIKFVSDLRHFFLGTLVSSTKKTDWHDLAEILLEVVLNKINLNLKLNQTNIR